MIALTTGPILLVIMLFIMVLWRRGRTSTRTTAVQSSSLPIAKSQHIADEIATTVRPLQPVAYDRDRDAMIFPRAHFERLANVLKASFGIADQAMGLRSSAPRSATQDNEVMDLMDLELDLPPTLVNSTRQRRTSTDAPTMPSIRRLRGGTTIRLRGS